MLETKKKAIIDAAYSVIKEEQLSSPTRIWIRTTLKGTMRMNGSCIRKRNITQYRLVVNTTKARWFDDPNGKYVDKNTKKRCRVADIGEERNDKEVIDILGHEIAHIKYWEHSPSHHSYTQHIIGMLVDRLKDVEGLEIE